MFDFRGLGLAAAVIRIFIGGLFGSFSAVHRWDAVTAGFFAALICYFLAGPGKELLAKATGTIINFSASRSLSFRTYLYWAPLFVGFAVCCLFTR